MIAFYAALTTGATALAIMVLQADLDIRGANHFVSSSYLQVIPLLNSWSADLARLNRWAIPATAGITTTIPGWALTH